MDNFNLRNMQLAYTAVYDQNLCESMEEIGLIGEGSSGQDQFELWVNELLDEGYDLSDYTWDELYENYQQLDEEERPYPIGKVERAGNRKQKTIEDPKSTLSQKLKASRQLATISQSYGSKLRNKPQPVAPGRQKQSESYDAFDVVLAYLLDEGFADTLEGAEAIMVNMSEGWIEGILMEKEGYGDAAIDKDPLTKFKPDAEAREYLKKNPYNVNKRFFSTSGPGRGSRGASDVSDVLQKMEGGSKPKRVIPSPKKSSSEPAPRKLSDPDRSKRAPKPRVLSNPKR